MKHSSILFGSLSIALFASLYACMGDDLPHSLSINGKSTSVLPEVALEDRTTVSNAVIFNDEASIPSQCYTDTQGQHNPCYTCHQMYDRQTDFRLNKLDDGGLQGAYIFSDVGVTNHWSNLFKDKQDWLKQVSDDAIQEYINTENYTGLAPRLKQQDWQGFIPDLANYQNAAAAFDERGLALDGSNWVAFNYKPFPGTFWPTNGATDDVLIRLDKPFRELNGKFNRNVYFINLTLAELNIKQMQEASIWPVDETQLGVDINQDGLLSVAKSVVRGTHYVGDAKHTPLEFQQFPLATEFMHSVRYVGVNDDDSIGIPARMKELRYMRKVNVLPRDTITSRYDNERKEKLLELLPNFISRGDEGFDNGQGWFVQGFIEDYNGELRPQSYEEGMFCMGCHAAIGTTLDSTFSYARKVTGESGWGYINLINMLDAPSMSEDEGEILNYFKRAGGGSEFRENPEMLERWYTQDGEVDVEKVKAADVYTLITPSKRRALDLNKAYSEIVRHQSFIYGRDATWLPAKNVYKEVDESIPPLQSKHRYYGWDIRLDWQK